MADDAGPATTPALSKMPSDSGGADVSRRASALLVPALSVFTVVVVATELGWVPPLEYAWGLRLWAYLPDAVALSLAASVLLWLVPPVRRRALAAIASLSRLASAPQKRTASILALVLLPIVLYVLREKLVFGDSRILYWSMNANPALFFFPDIGATFLLQTGYRLGHFSGVGGLPVVQGLICLCASLTLYFFIRAARELTETTAQVVLLVGLVLANGAARTFAGHLEVYGFVLVTAGAYIWASLLHIRGRTSWIWPALAFGAGLWVHIQYLFLIPSLMVVLSSAPELRGAPLSRHIRRMSIAALVTFAPTLIFFAVLLAIGHGQDLIGAVEKMKAWSTVGPTDGPEAWIRFWGGAGSGTRYMIFSLAHWKYLLNSFFLLAPFTIPLLLFCLLRPRQLWETPEARFLTSACATMLLYTAIIRPVHGPYDWDLFALTGAFLGTLAGHLLARQLSESHLLDISGLVIGVALLTTSLPLVAVGIEARSTSGPFSPDMVLREPGDTVEATFERKLGPWL